MKSYLNDCRTAFIKHVLPKFLKPAVLILQYLRLSERFNFFRSVSIVSSDLDSKFSELNY